MHAAEEINRTGCTALDLVGIHLFDDGVRDHGGAGSHTENEQREPTGRAEYRGFGSAEEGRLGHIHDLGRLAIEYRLKHP